MPVCTVPLAVTVDWMSSDTTKKIYFAVCESQRGFASREDPAIGAAEHSCVGELSWAVVPIGPPDVGPIEGVEPRGNPGGEGEIAWGPALP